MAAANLGPLISPLTGTEKIALDNSGTVELNPPSGTSNYTTANDIANLAVPVAGALKLTGGTMTGEITFSAGTTPAISISPTSYHVAGDIQLNDFGVMKIGTVSNTSGASFISAVVQEVTSNFHTFEDTYSWTPTTAGLGAASFNAGGILNDTSAAVNHMNGFQYTGQMNSTNGSSIVRGFHSTPNISKGTVTSVNGIEIADPAITSGGVVTGMYAFVYNGSGTAAYNWGVYQSNAGSTSHGPWNYMNGPLGLGVQVPNAANCGVMLGATRTIGWGAGNGSSQTTVISQPASGVLNCTGQIQAASGVAYNTNASTSASTLLTAANISGGSIDVTLNLTGAISSASNAQLPTVGSLNTALNGVVVGQGYKLRIINGAGTGSGVWTLTTNTGWTFTVTTATIAASLGYMDYYITFQSAAAATIQSLGGGTITAL